MPRVRSIFISDIHLGTPACQAERLLDFLKFYESEYLFLVGDVVDFWAMRRRDWYRAAPFLPLPPAEYLRWRMHTAYGDEDAVPPIRDVLRFARWRRDILRS